MRWYSSLFLWEWLAVSGSGTQEPACVLRGGPAKVGLSFHCVPALFGWKNASQASITAPALAPPAAFPGGCECACVGDCAAAGPFVAVVPRGGGCGFASKAIAAEACGAVGLIVVNNVDAKGDATAAAAADSADDEVDTGAFAMGASPEDADRVTIPVAMAPKNWLKVQWGRDQAEDNEK